MGSPSPGDISLIGYDDSFYTNDIGLTTIRQDPAEMARTAARMTLDLIQGHELSPAFVDVPAQLVVRSSTASVRH